MMEKVVGVTGASGYIGGTICIELKRLGYFVVGLDKVKHEHLSPYIDLFYQEDFEEIPRSSSSVWKGCDAIIHCAGTSLVGPSISEPINYYNNNVAKTIKLLDWAAVNKKHILFSSSASVYKTSNLPLKEVDPTEPLSTYAKSKLMVEHVIKDYMRAYNAPATIFRYFNACGAVKDLHGQIPGSTHLFPKLFEEKNFKLNGDDFSTKDGTCVRDYIHVLDIASAHIKAIEKKLFGIYNLGSGIGFSNLEIMKAVGVKEWITLPRRDGDSDCLVADISLASKNLEWKPTCFLPEIVSDLKTWYGSKTFQQLKLKSGL